MQTSSTPNDRLSPKAAQSAPSHHGARRDWLAVASADHVARGLAGGFMQVCHGKSGPLRRLRAGDRVAYYSPGRRMGGVADIRSITAIGVVADDVVTQADMGGGFQPWRRHVDWIAADPLPVAALQADPRFELSGPGWGARLRCGLIRLEAASMDVIAEAALVAN